MATPVYYVGPGKVAYTVPGTGTVVGLQPNEPNGNITLTVDEKTTERGAAEFGALFETLDDVTTKIVMSPFDNWSLVQYMFPQYLGVTSAAGAGALAIGTNPFDPANTGSIYPTAVLGTDGTLYDCVRCCISKHPSMKLGPGEKLFGAVEMSGFGQLVQSSATGVPGTAGFLMAQAFGDTSTSPITEVAPTSGQIGYGAASDPTTTGGFTTSDFAQTRWTAAWGAIAGFVGVEAETGWDLVADVKYNTYSSQRISRLMTLSSAKFMLKGRFVGGSATQLLGQVLSHTSGGILTGTSVSRGAATNLVLTGSNNRTITLVNAEMKGAGFVFGGTQLRNGEVGWVTNVTFSGGLPLPQLIFSS